ncbi:MAG: GIY-YIG nuclease family protein [Pseudomonadales bacterium]|jgi:putative endonuclease|nr:GIY-YIG nuclease family protein [Pseudomonadales bacterium]
MENAIAQQGKQSWYVYMIRANDNSLYTGITTDLARRLAEHKGEAAGAYKGAKALRSKRRLEMVFSHKVENRSKASRLESRIKRLSKTKKEALVLGKLNLENLEGDS